MWSRVWSYLVWPEAAGWLWTRRRWFTRTAVAVLLLGMMGAGPAIATLFGFAKYATSVGFFWYC